MAYLSKNIPTPTAPKLRIGKREGRPYAEPMPVYDHLHVITKHIDGDLGASISKEADGVERELELRAGAHERATNRLGFIALP